MKKKTIIPLGLFIFIYFLVFLVILALSLYFILKRDLQVFAYILLVILNLVMIYYFLTPIIFYTIRIKDSIIKMNNDFGFFKEDRIQHKVDIDLKEVKEFRVILSDRDSNGDPYKAKVQKRKYIEFFMKDDTKKRVYVSYLNNKQLHKLVSIITEISNVEISNE